MQKTIHTLTNGLTVILIDTQAFPSLTTLLLVGAGSRYETEANNGVAHFFEHMAFKGSQKYPNSFTIASAIEGIGGVFNAFTAKDHTGYWIKSTASHFDTVIDVISDMVTHPRLAPEEIEREKGVITEEINMYEDMPQRKVSEVYENLLYDGHPLGFDIAGKKETIARFTQETFKNYIDQLYHPRNAVLVVAGGLNKVERQKGKVHKGLNYIDTIEKKFAHWSNGKKADFARIEEKQNAPAIRLVYKKTEQAHFCVGFRTFSFFDKRKYALSVLSAILGGGMSSRLFIEVRERRGLCYYVGTSKESYHDAGTMVTQAGVKVNADTVKQALEIILKEHKQIAQGKIRKGELERAKELIKGRLTLSLEDSFAVASLYGGKKILENDIEDPASMIGKIEAVSADDVVETACDIVSNERLNMAIIGPFEDKKPFVQLFTTFALKSIL